MSSATTPGDPATAGRAPRPGWPKRRTTGLLVLANGEVIEGFGVGAVGSAVGEVCFNTAMTGYQEILTDPSYAAQIITFTFPHIGIVGVNDEDIETVNLAASAAAVGAVFRAELSESSNFRAKSRLDPWLESRNVVGLAGVDTRALTTLIRKAGMPNAVIAHDPEGRFDLGDLKRRAAAWPGIDGMDLVPSVTSAQRYDWSETSWSLGQGYGRREATRFHVVAIDYGIKRNILRLLNDSGCAVTVVPATTSAEAILALEPDGIFLSNGPGDPAATGVYAVPTIRALLETRIPLFGICLGHQTARPRGRRAHGQNAAGPSRRESPGQGLHHRQGGNRLDEPWLRRRAGEPARYGGRNPCLAVRRIELRRRADRSAGVFGAISSGSLARPARQPVSLPPLRRRDGRRQGRARFQRGVREEAGETNSAPRGLKSPLAFWR